MILRHIGHRRQERPSSQVLPLLKQAAIILIVCLRQIRRRQRRTVKTPLAVLFHSSLSFPCNVERYGAIVTWPEGLSIGPELKQSTSSLPVTAYDINTPVGTSNLSSPQASHLPPRSGELGPLDGFACLARNLPAPAQRLAVLLRQLLSGSNFLQLA